MSILAQATEAPAPQTKNSAHVALFYAGLLVVMAVGQLFSFEKFIPLVESFGLPGGHGMATAIAGVLVVAEVFALPFLLQMRLSPLMRVCSMALGWLVALVWMGLSLWLVTTGAMGNVGIFGASVILPVGLWAVFYAAALLVLAIWSSWGLWPRNRR